MVAAVATAAAEVVVPEELVLHVELVVVVADAVVVRIILLQLHPAKMVEAVAVVADQVEG